MAKRKPKKSVTMNPFGIEPMFAKGDTPTDDAERRKVYGDSSGWYNYENSLKDHVSYVLDYAKEVLSYSKDEVKTLKKLSDSKIAGLIGIPCHMHYRGWELNDDEANQISTSMKTKLTEALSYADEAEVVEPTIVLTPAQKIMMKVNSTIGYDYDLTMEAFAEGNYSTKFSAFNLMKSYNLTAAHVNYFAKEVERDFATVRDAYNKVCDQAVEAFSHVKRPDLKKRFELLEGILNDVEQFKSTKKAVRGTRVKKPKAADKQVKKLKFKTEDNTYKVTSINPALIPSNYILWTFNTKTRVLTMFKTDSVDGLSVKGTTINGFNPSLSKCTTLRKPEDVLKLVLKGPIKKTEKVWDSLTTKIREPKGRVNEEVILLRTA